MSAATTSESKIMTAEPTDERAAAEALKERLGLAVDLPSLEAALTHPSYTNERPECPDNQRLEFLGDAVLGLCVSELLMAAFQDVDEGQLTVMRASLVNAGALAAIARRLQLGAALRLGRGADAAGERDRKNVLADAMEAVFGAVFQDAGLDACRALTHDLVGAVIAKLVDSGGIRRDAKSRLQETLQAAGEPPPRYEVVSTEGPPHARSFIVRAVVAQSGKPDLVAEGTGRSKKLAEQVAATRALDLLEAIES